MKSCRSALSVLLLLTITTVAESDHTSVKAKLHDSAVLPCSERCSGVVRWTLYSVSETSDTLAECDQTSCRSVKEGYQMIHDQYLKGDLSLTITEADFSKRGLYTCKCDGNKLCDVQLLIEPLKSEVMVKVGESLVLQLHISDPVEVIYNSTGSANQSSGLICKVVKRSLQCEQEYTHRISQSPALELRGMNVSDSGVYTVWDTENKEVIRIYTVSVYDDSEAQDQKQKPSASCTTPSDGQSSYQGAVVPAWALGVSVPAFMILGGVIVLLWRKIQCLQKKSARNDNQINMNELGNNTAEELERLPVQGQV